MPHAGLMNETLLGAVKGPLQRARLHLRGGKRRLRQGKIAAGIVTLYDGLLAAMEFYREAAVQEDGLAQKPGEDLRDENVLYGVLVRKGVLNGRFDFGAFNRLVETALHEELPGYDYRQLVADIDSVMLQLGVMPFDESALPPEDPATF